MAMEVGLVLAPPEPAASFIDVCSERRLPSHARPSAYPKLWLPRYYSKSQLKSRKVFFFQIIVMSQMTRNTRTPRVLGRADIANWLATIAFVRCLPPRSWLI